MPRAAYSVPHDYPSSAPAYQSAPMPERERPAADQLRLYVHVPFCRYHCTFCYFAVRVGASADVMRRYVRAVIKELEWIEPGTPLSQLFVGGGTPTALPPDLLDELLGAIFARTRPYGKHVHTVETSPETISPEHIAVLKRHGIGRVSMGVQSLDASVLDTVHREQTMSQALAACDLLVGSGLIVNVDLIYGLPRQTEETFWHDISTVAAHGRARVDPLQPPRERAHAGEAHAGRRRALRPRQPHALARLRGPLRRRARLHADALAHLQAHGLRGPRARAPAHLRQTPCPASSSASA